MAARHAWFLSISLLSATALAAQTGVRIQDVELSVERRLLVLDLASYRELRVHEDAILVKLSEAQGRLDRALTRDTMTLGSLEGLDDEVTADRAAARIGAERVDRQLDRIHERLRRMAVLSDNGRTPADPISGRWRVLIGPGNLGGTFELHLDGTAVSGSYRMDDASTGSLRGTYVSGVLTVGRIDTQGGTDRSFSGSVNEAAGTISGIWQSRDLATNQPSTGGWSGAKSREGAQ
jgi:hypothetical protein